MIKYHNQGNYVERGLFELMASELRIYYGEAMEQQVADWEITSQTGSREKLEMVESLELSKPIPVAYILQQAHSF